MSDAEKLLRLAEFVKASVDLVREIRAKDGGADLESVALQLAGVAFELADAMRFRRLRR